jgi:hypothetical protein
LSFSADSAFVLITVKFIISLTLSLKRDRYINLGSVLADLRLGANPPDDVTIYLAWREGKVWSSVELHPPDSKFPHLAKKSQLVPRSRQAYR